MPQPKSNEGTIKEFLTRFGANKIWVNPSKENVETILEIEQFIRQALAQKDKEVVELTKDKERLDFLDKCNRGLNEYFGTTYKWEFILNHNVTRLMCGQGRAGDIDVDLNDANALGLPSCRDAIDKKMAEVTTPKE